MPCAEPGSSTGGFDAAQQCWLLLKLNVRQQVSGMTDQTQSSTASAAKARIPVAVLTAADESLPPGLEEIQDSAELVHARDADSLRGALRKAQVLLVTDFRTRLLEQYWSEAQEISWVHATSAGVDAMLFPALRDSDIPLTNAKGIFDRPIAEFVLGQILAFAKDMPRSWHLQQQRRWQHRETERIEGRRVLVVGAGSIGRQIARLLRAVGMLVQGVARKPRQSDPDFDRVHGQDQLLHVLPDAEFVVLATPLTADTRGLIGHEALKAMRRDARLINIARGPVVQTAALLDALRGGWIAGAALDVFEEEPLPSHHPLYSLSNVLLSAHMAGDVIGWREALSAQFIDNFRRWQRGEPLANQVDKQLGYVASS